MSLICFHCTTNLHSHEFPQFSIYLQNLIPIQYLFEEYSPSSYVAFGGMVEETYIIKIQELPQVVSIKCLDQTIDWLNQWSKSPYFDPLSQLLNVPLPKENTQNLLLSPGAGFGDLMHPSTELVFSHLTEFKDWSSPVIDIGCGSGVLSIAASLMGMKPVIGLDIELEAIEHALYNQQLNQTDVIFSQKLPDNISLQAPLLCLMNMISSEQEIAWETLRPHLEKTSGYLVTSGILIDEKDDYLKKAETKGWTLKNLKQQEQWLCCTFSF